MIGILGSGGHASEVEEYSSDSTSFKAVEKDYLEDGLVDVRSPSEDQKKVSVVAAVGSPLVRKRIVEAWPGNRFASVISKHSIVSMGVKVGEGTQLAPNSVIMAGCIIGKHVIVNTGATISHGTRVGDYVTVSPGVSVGGNVFIDDGVFLGIGSSVVNNVSIASGVVLGAGSVLLADADVQNGVYAGVPARLVKQNNGWIESI